MGRRGFTIVELLIVIVVIAILASITIVAYNGIQTRSRNNIRIADLKSIQKIVELYKADNGSYPVTSSWRGVCQLFGSDFAYVPSASTYVTSALPVDPRWKQPSDDKCYLYRSDGTDYMVLAWKTFEAGCGNGDPGNACQPADIQAMDRKSQTEASLAVYSPGAVNW